MRQGSRSQSVETDRRESTGRAVSPVLAVVLLVAITVTFALVAAPIAFGVVSDFENSAPSGEFSFFYADRDGTQTDHFGTSTAVADRAGLVTIKFKRGSTIDPANIEIRTPHSGGNLAADVTDDEFIQDGLLRPGASFSVVATPGDTVRIIWRSPDGDSSAILGSFTVRGPGQALPPGVPEPTLGCEWVEARTDADGNFVAEEGTHFDSSDVVDCEQFPNIVTESVDINGSLALIAPIDVTQVTDLKNDAAVFAGLYGGVQTGSAQLSMATLQGDISSDQQVSLTEDSSVVGDIESSQGVSLTDSASQRIDALQTVTLIRSESGDIETSEGVELDDSTAGSIDALQTVNLTNAASGDIQTNEGVTLEQSVAGNVDALQTVTLTGSESGTVKTGEQAILTDSTSDNIDAELNVTLDGSTGDHIKSGQSVSLLLGSTSDDIDAAQHVTLDQSIAGNIDAGADVTLGNSTTGNIEAGGSVTLDGNESASIDAGQNVELTNANASTISAEGTVTLTDSHVLGDVLASEIICHGDSTINGEPCDEYEMSALTVTILDTNEPVAEGETLNVSVELENLGTETDTQDVVLRDFDGTVQDEQSVTLDGENTTTLTLSWNTQPGDADTDEIVVETDDDSEKRTVTIEADIDPDITSIDVDAFGDEILNVTIGTEGTGVGAYTLEIWSYDGGSPGGEVDRISNEPAESEVSVALDGRADGQGQHELVADEVTVDLFDGDGNFIARAVATD